MRFEMDASTIDPFAMRPESIGLRWGMSRSECASALQVRPVKGREDAKGIGFLSFKLPIADTQESITLLFDQAGGLWGVSTTLYMSRDFWDGNYTAEEVEQLT